MAARLSPWLPVAISTTLSRGRWAKASSAEKIRHAIKIAAFARDLQRRAPWRARPARPGGRRRWRPGDGADARDIGGESRDQRRGPSRFGDDFAQRWRPHRLPRADPLAQDIGRIADEREDAFVADLRQPLFIGRRAKARLGVDFPVAECSTVPSGRPDGERAAFGNRMRHGDEFDRKRPDRRPLPPCGTTLIGTSGAPGSARRLGAQKLGGETRGVKRAAKVRPEIGDGADMILMRMGDDEAEQILLRSFR